MLPSGSGTRRVARNTWKPRNGFSASPGRTAMMTPLQWPMRCFSEFMSPWMRAQASRFHRGLHEIDLGLEGNDRHRVASSAGLCVSLSFVCRSLSAPVGGQGRQSSRISRLPAGTGNALFLLGADPVSVDVGSVAEPDRRALRRKGTCPHHKQAWPVGARRLLACSTRASVASRCCARCAASCRTQDFIYLGDTARLPYGTKSAASVVRYAEQAADVLVARGLRCLVVACNTASAVALEPLRRRYAPLPVVGVVEPGARAACAATRSGRIAVIATEGTVRAGAYEHAIRELRPGCECRLGALPAVRRTGGGGLDGRARWSTSSPIVISTRSSPWRGKPDVLLLGCTHFPVLAAAIAGVAGADITLVDSAATTAAAVRNLLGIDAAASRYRQLDCWRPMAPRVSPASAPRSSASRSRPMGSRSWISVYEIVNCGNRDSCG